MIPAFRRTLISFAPFLLVMFAGHARAGQPATASALPVTPTLIEVDGACRILNVDIRKPNLPAPRRPYSSSICNIESEKASQRWEQSFRANGTPFNRLADIREKDFVLQNPYPQRLTFLIYQPIPKNFHIDSDPPPSDLSNGVATFRVVADPSRTIRIHVGWRD